MLTVWVPLEVVVWVFIQQVAVLKEYVGCSIWWVLCCIFHYTLQKLHLTVFFSVVTSEKYIQHLNSSDGPQYWQAANFELALIHRSRHPLAYAPLPCSHFKVFQPTPQYDFSSNEISQAPKGIRMYQSIWFPCGGANLSEWQRKWANEIRKLVSCSLQRDLV